VSDRGSARSGIEQGTLLDSQDSPRIYKDRYCAFVDILGFRQLIDRLNKDNSQFDALRNLLMRVHSAHHGGSIEKSDSDFRAQSISDAVAISTTPTQKGLAEIFRALQSLAVDLLVEGYFVRGAVVRASLYHDDRMVFGSALIQAYSFESEVAKYPRIIVAREVREDMVRFAAKSKNLNSFPKIDCLRQSSDGPMYLDVLQPVVSLFKKKEHPFEDLSPEEKTNHRRYLGIRDKIQERFEESMDTPRHFEKVRWFARYWNDVIPQKLFMRIRDADRNF
jgi:hypothetical protein